MKTIAGETYHNKWTEKVDSGILGGAGFLDFIFAPDDAVLSIVESHVVFELALGLFAEFFVTGEEEDDVDGGDGFVELLVEFLVEFEHVFFDLARFDQGVGLMSGVPGIPFEAEFSGIAVNTVALIQDARRHALGLTLGVDAVHFAADALLHLGNF
ncbi:MAG: hypothetical protein ACPGGN_08345, partial [Opitutales bacterium]